MKVVAVTGASAGIGLAVAQECARRGHAVVLCARRGELITEASERIRAEGGRALAVVADVTIPEDMERLVREAVETFGHLDVLVANAGIGYHDTFERTPVDVMRRLMDVNVMGTLWAARAATPHFLARGSGHLIAVSSIVGRRGIAGSTVYSATKAAQAGLIESLRAEWAGTALKATAVYPISTATDFHETIRRDYGYEVKGLGPRQTAASVAVAIADAIERPRPEVYPYRRARLLSILNIVWPSAADRLVQKFSRKRLPGGGQA